MGTRLHLWALLLASCLPAVQSDAAAAAACQSQYYTAVAASPGSFPCAALDVYARCLPGAIADLSAAAAVVYQQLLQTEQQDHSNCAALYASPSITTANSSLFVQVGQNRDVKFIRAPLDSVSLFALFGCFLAFLSVITNSKPIA